MATSDSHRPEHENVNDVVRRDGHLALGCGLAFALVVTTALIIYILVSA